MFGLIPVNILRLLLLLALQVLVFNNLRLGSFINPYVYPLFILLLPFETPRWLLLLLGFGVGITLDFFLGTMGMHAAACVLLAYIRPYLISVITPKGADFEVAPSFYLQGPTWFVIYCGLSVLIHHTYYFIIESGTFYNIFFSILRIVCSSFFSILFMVIFMILFSSSRKRRLT